MIITLTTDFGLADAYAGVIKGVILGANPEATLVDISHNIAPQDVRGAAFLLHISHGFFPPGTVHLAVVDPGVGASRLPIALVTPNATFVAPDNGLLSYVAGDRLTSTSPHTRDHLTPAALPSGFKAVHLNKPRYWRQPVSRTFHARDVFAPVAAQLSLGTPLEDLGEPISSILAFPVPRPQRQVDGSMIGHVQHIDAFGNLITDVREEDLEKGRLAVDIAGRRISGLSMSYAEGKDLLAIVGSSGYLEIALRDGSAARILTALVGDSFTLRFE
ncbi:MAG: SAM-dependent chlorinase/fluorinase [Chloroflexi bacterium]|nr:SAM-dependent chlorinase/fluorinase [Chloroflexota bacterium]